MGNSEASNTGYWDGTGGTPTKLMRAICVFILDREETGWATPRNAWLPIVWRSKQDRLVNTPGRYKWNIT